MIAFIGVRVRRTNFFRSRQTLFSPVAGPEPGSRRDGGNGRILFVCRSHKIAFYDGAFAGRCQVLRLLPDLLLAAIGKPTTIPPGQHGNNHAGLRLPALLALDPMNLPTIPKDA